VGDFRADRRNISRDAREAAIRELARRQWGNLSRTQLLEVGLTAGGIDRRLRNGSLVARHTGVYAVAPARQDPSALAAAAVLAGGPHAVASHWSAAYLWGFLNHWKAPPEIIVTQGDRRPRRIHTHRCQSLQPQDLTRQRSVPTTSPARTLLDIAPRLTTQQLTRMVNDALRSRHLRIAALADVLDRTPLHPGTKLLRPFVDNPSNPTNSGFEDDFRAFVVTYGLPTPEINADLNGRQVDVLFRATRSSSNWTAGTSTRSGRHSKTPASGMPRTSGSGS
jgi:hypothetical protein